MPIYKFKSTVEEIATEKSLHLVGSQERLIWNIEKGLERGEITPDQVADMLKDDKDFRLHFTRDDFEKIERAIK